MSSLFSRRAFLASASAATVACGRRTRVGFSGFAFVANEEGHAIAAVDLNAFAVVRHIRLDAAPTHLLSHPSRQAVYALTPSTGAIHEISRETLKRSRSVSLGGTPVYMRSGPDGDSLWVAMRQPKQLLRVKLDTLQVAQRLPLPEEPVDFDLALEQPVAIVSFGPAGSAALLPLEVGRSQIVPFRSPIGAVRFFRKDGRQWTAAHTERKLSVIDTATSRVVVKLPLAMRPDNLCFKADLGQLFITGEGSDAVAIVFPYSTEVAETILAGRNPGPMATSYSGATEFLFVTNPQSNQVTILNIETRKVVAITQVGAEPSHVVITPNNQYALVLNRRSGDMAVIDLYPYQTAARRTRFPAALFTIIPVGSKPVSAVVQAV